MRPSDIGIGVNYGRGHVYSGDILVCPDCKEQVIVTASNAVYDADYDLFEMYLNMDPDSDMQLCTGDKRQALKAG